MIICFCNALFYTNIKAICFIKITNCNKTHSCVTPIIKLMVTFGHFQTKCNYHVVIHVFNSYDLIHVSRLGSTYYTFRENLRNTKSFGIRWSGVAAIVCVVSSILQVNDGDGFNAYSPLFSMTYTNLWRMGILKHYIFSFLTFFLAGVFSVLCCLVWISSPRTFWILRILVMELGNSIYFFHLKNTCRNLCCCRLYVTVNTMEKNKYNTYHLWK